MLSSCNEPPLLNKVFSNDAKMVLRCLSAFLSDQFVVSIIDIKNATLEFADIIENNNL